MSHQLPLPLPRIVKCGAHEPAGLIQCRVLAHKHLFRAGDDRDYAKVLSLLRTKDVPQRVRLAYMAGVSLFTSQQEATA